MLVNCVAYQNGTGLAAIPAEEISGYLERPGCFVWVSLCDAADSELEKLLAACDKHACDIHAYVLMTNHVHLLITPQDEQGLGKTLQMLGRYYVQYYNYSYQRTGTLWEGRYKATLIDSEAYLLACCATWTTGWCWRPRAGSCVRPSGR